MNIKSLLLGSAAALLAVSGARAADAVEVVAEPEPMDYVRICDTYGTGFYYIPGTETCLRVGGYIRYDIGVGDAFGETSVDKEDAARYIAWLEAGGEGPEPSVSFNDTYYKRARAAVQLDARTETELGTLRGYMHINFNYDTADNGISVLGVRPGSSVLGVGVSDSADNFGINHAYIELGGFRIGKTDSLFTTFTDYAGGVINDDFVVPFGPYGTHQIAYTFDAGNGFTAAVALETGDGDATIATIPVGGGIPIRANVYSIDSYIPHVVAGVGYTGGWGSIRVVGGYDSVWEEFAAKAKLEVKASDALSLFVMGGWKSDENNFNYYGNWGGDWAVWGGLTYQASEKAAINVQLAYDDFENFSAVANVAYTLVPGFTITPEVAYYDNFDADDADGFGGFLRFQRNF